MDNLAVLAQHLLIALGFFSIAIAATVAARFLWITYYQNRPGLKPWHVWLVGLSYSVYAVMAATSRLNDLGDPLVRWIGYAVAVLSGTAALLIIGWYQWRLGRKE